MEGTDLVPVMVKGQLTKEQGFCPSPCPTALILKLVTVVPPCMYLGGAAASKLELRMSF